MISYILCGIIILQYIVHHVERRDLYNRIMSKTLNEYKSDTVHSVKSAHERMIKRWRGRKDDE
jgi:hypothetical protein